MLSLLGIIALGFFLGMRHATDPDHVIAVSTIVSRERSLKQAGLIGLAWGTGHTLTILAVGSAIILFRIALPPRLGLGMELAVALMLILLGLYNLRGMFSAAIAPHVPAQDDHPHYHAHGDFIHVHAHPQPHQHPHDSQHTPLGAIDRWFGRLTVYQVLRPLLVGIVHGLAGSAAIALLVLSTIQSFRWAVVYLLVFGIGTILGMMLITGAIASTVSYGQRRYANIGRHFGVASGAISLAFGLFIAYQIGFVDGLFTSHVHWIPR